MTITDVYTNAARGSLGKPRVDTGVVDLDIHPTPPSGALESYLPERWRQHIERYGIRTYSGNVANIDIPPYAEGAQRGDSWPVGGGPTGSDLALMQEQILDLYNIQLGTLECLTAAASALDQGLGAALCAAANEWQFDTFVYPDPRLRLAMLIPFESAELAVKEIERIGADDGVASIYFNAKTYEPMGNKRYWPIYEAAVALDKPIQQHLSGNGGHPNTGIGWTSYHPDYHTAHTQPAQSQVASMILSGVFEQFPTLRFISVENGLLHYGGFLDRLDHTWETLRDELPDLKRKPSEYFKEHVWIATQPMDEPDNPQHFMDIVGEIGEDRVVFSTDYPHFDFDSPTTSLPAGISEDFKEKLLRGNAKELFKLD